MKFIFLLITITLGFAIMFLNPRVWATSPTEKTSVSQPSLKQELSRAKVRALMHEIFTSFAALRPYMISEEKFKASENAPTISAELSSLNEKIKLAAHEPMLQTPNFRISRQVLQEHVSDMQRVFKLGNKEYSRWALNSTMSICMACHSQLPSRSSSGLVLDENGIFTKSFDRAEWLFVARNFDKALELYNNVIRSFPANKATTEQVENALERAIAIHSKVKRDFKEAVTELKKDLNNKDLPSYIQTNIQGWIQTLTKLQEEKLPNPEKASPEEIRKFVEKHLNEKDKGIEGENTRAVKYLVVSGIVYEYLNTHPQSEMVPELLHWLATCDRNTNNNFFYSLADVYLKQCILNHPSHPVAKQCYKDYELYTIASYSGSSGTHLPAEISRELKELKKLVEQPPTLMKKK